MLMKLKKNKKGFTLAELLIVIGIIAVLVAILIPTISGAVNKAQLAADAANVRSRYYEYVAAALLNDTTPATTAYTRFTTGVIDTGTSPAYVATTGILTLSRGSATPITVIFDPAIVTS